ncbi:hypothetical protein GGP89_003272 [Salinibacter ruber]|jgi:hypothetical protein|uniref:Uncharacterized protein n=1 Tax=Salinibacter ruber TaxID=146919 RepID=A0A9X2U4G8_9BACT|nr:hypothetical protein [Salinibacter ruber]MCS3859864.1 hypothetical protein [Salinibacter ruber]MCS3866692.1 hypothetical protein [Salinibacter ruber]
MDSLPHLETIFNKLRRGYHFTPEDGEVFRPLWERFDEYERLLDSLGLDLRKHPQNVVYLVANDNVQPGTQAKKMGLFMMVLVEHFGETHSSIVPSLFDAVFRIEDLPHLKKARYEEYMNAIGIHDTEDLKGIVGSMDRFGFAEEKSNGFKLRTAAYRFLDLCREASDLGENASDDEERSEAEPGPNATGTPPATFASLDTEEESSSTGPETESPGL